MSSPSYALHVQRARALSLVVLTALLFGSALANPALAYAGQELLTWVADNIIFPLGIITLVLSLAAAMVRPDLVRSAVWATVICAIIFFVIRSAPQLQAAISAG